jgi:hypothetical protein
VSGAAAPSAGVPVAVVPSAPLLLPGLTGRTDPVPDLRSAVAGVVADLVAARPDEVVVLAEAEPSGEHEVGAELGLHRWAVGAGTAERAGRADVPLPFAVASVLLDAAGWDGPRRFVAVAPGTPPQDAAGAGAATGGDGRAGYLVLAEGTACRTEKAPGHIDPRAAPFDDALLAAVGTDLDGVLAVDPALAAELWVHGLAAWQALAGALGQGATLATRWTGDPFGVLYVVAGAHLRADVPGQDD